MKPIASLAALFLVFLTLLLAPFGLAAKPSVQDVFIFGPSELNPGAPAAIRVVVMEATALDRSAPVADAAVEVWLEGKSGKRKLLSSRTNAQGTVDEAMKVPAELEGEHELVVKVDSRLGKTEKRHPVTIAPRFRALLSTDKPLYQPNQIIHLRTVALRLYDLHPVAGSTVTLEVEDPQGNKVFKKLGKTDDFGVFAADFQLADEIRLGTYKLRALVGERETEKTVEVKRYVLPKFKVTVDTDKSFYRPGEKVKGTLSADYFFGKPVDGGKVKVVAKAFDVEFHEVAEALGKTGKDGKFEFELTLPDTFVGQPLEQGDAFVQLEAEVTDRADHKEIASTSRKVAGQDLKLELVPEAGRLVPGIENQIYVVAATPDDKPAKAKIKLTVGGQTLAAQTDAAGVAVIAFTPKADAFAPGPDGKPLLAVQLEAESETGAKATLQRDLSADHLRDQVLLRTDRAIYRAGEDMKLEVFATRGAGTVYLDLIRDRKTVLTRAMDLADGRAALTVGLEPELFGTLELHAYLILPSGEIMRDARVVYVEQADDLKISVRLDQETYRPGETAKLVFTVTDQKGDAKPAALGLSIVDESVFAIQEMQPGLLKVYFTLEQEIMKPRYEVHFAPGGRDVEAVIQDREEARAEKDQVMRVLLAGVQAPTEAGWTENPAQGRAQAESEKLSQFAYYFLSWVSIHPFLEADPKGGWRYRQDIVTRMQKDLKVDKSQLTDSFGAPYTPEALTLLDPALTPEAVAGGVASHRLLLVYQAIHRYYQEDQKSFVDKLFDGGQIAEVPADVFAKIVEKKYLVPAYLTDPWGNKYVVTKLDKAKPNPYQPVFNNFEIVSPGPDGKLGTKDDVADPYLFARTSWLANLGYGVAVDGSGLLHKLRQRGEMLAGGPMLMMREDKAAMPMAAEAAKGEGMVKDKEQQGGGAKDGKPAVRVREYFPETLLWAPSIITGGDGVAKLTVPMADSITTWRMTALGHSKDGLLGSMTGSARVFQDFFVDIDFPVELTQGDEVEIPVAVYNYLKGPQQVKLEVTEHDGFELLSPGVQELSLAEGQVDVRYFRVRADVVGKKTLTVLATGDKLSDAIKRSVEVVPNGMRFEVVKNGRLTGPLDETIEVPAEAIADASRVMVKIYPGVFAQVLEGLDGLFRMPSGCFEQTTSTTYPNVMTLAYMKKTKTISPEIQMKAEEYINLGYQRLLSFEVQGGGFEWFGNPPANKVLTAYGLMEFYDMSKVHDVDPNVISRTQQWLADQQEPDGSYKPVEHWLETLSGEGFSRSVELNTAYIAWALAESEYKGPALEKAIKYLKDRLEKLEDAYTLALVLNALISADPKDDKAREIIGRLEKLATLDPKTGTAHWQPKGQTAVHGEGKSGMIETTALILYAMTRARVNPTLVNQGLAWLAQQKDAFGTFESTQATILSFKALLAAEEGGAADVRGDLTVSLAGRAEKLSITPETSDVMRLVDFKPETKVGQNLVKIDAPADLGLMYQVLGVFYLPWDKIKKPERPPLLSLAVNYDRAQLKTDDLLAATVKAEYLGDQATDMVILDLGLPPGFTLLTDAFDQLKEKKAIEKYTVTGRQITVYVRRMEKGKPLEFRYQLRAKFPVKAVTPKSSAYQYYNPEVKIETAPTNLEVVK